MSMTPPFGTSVALRRGRGRGGGVFLVTALLLSAGCATKGDLRRLQDEVAGQAVRQEAQLEDLSADLQDLQDSLQVQSAIANEMVVDTRGGLARQLRDLQTQQSQMVQLIGQIQREVALMSQRLQADGGRVTTSTLRVDPDSLGALIGRGGGGQADCEQIWGAAIIQFNRGSNAAARAGFNGFLRDCPEDERVARARFNLGDIAAQQDRPDDAIEEFLRIAQLDPEADEVPLAQYRIGLLYLEQGNVQQARTYLELVVNSYPDDPVAELARAELQGIR
ncbi:MAG TPA: tetratricopeptide repeat protein [Candidatus Latescibacteria bacterium]|nr:tetratricopeptide repeat protein [Candidatus Latescibacterota bacterium]